MALAFVTVGHLKYSMFAFDGKIFVLRYFPFSAARVELTEFILAGGKGLLSIDELYEANSLVLRARLLKH